MPAKRRAGKSFAVNVTVRVRPALTHAEQGRVDGAEAEASAAAHSGTARRAVHARAGEGTPVCLVGGDDVWRAGQVAVAGVATGVKVFKCFSHVVGPELSQAAAQDVLMPGFLDGFLDGYDCTLFAYGQTGSGKTHTMFGPPGGVNKTSLDAVSAGDVPSQWGMFPRTALQILHRVGLVSAGGAGQGLGVGAADVAGGAAAGAGGAGAGGEGGPPDVSLSLSAVEVYFDQIFDLLDGKKPVRIGGVGRCRPDIQRRLVTNTRDKDGKWVAPYKDGKITGAHDRQRGSNFGMKGQKEVPLTTPEDVTRITKLVEATRIAHGHKLNHRSSRSHCIVTVCLTQRRGATITKSSFRFVDLAGSERVFKSGAEGTRKKEAVSVNTSLTALGRCIACLADGKRGAVVPFRDSTLTQLMKSSLAGSCRTALVVTVAQDPLHGDETLSSLRFGKRCCSVSNRAVRNTRSAHEAVAELRARLAEAERQLKELGRLGMAGGIDTTQAQCIQDSFWTEKAKLDAAKATQAQCKAELCELEAAGLKGSAKHAAVTTRLENAAQAEWVEHGVVMRMIYSGLWKPPRRAYSAKEAEVRQLRDRLARLAPAGAGGGAGAVGAQGGKSRPGRTRGRVAQHAAPGATCNTRDSGVPSHRS